MTTPHPTPIMALMFKSNWTMKGTGPANSCLAIENANVSTPRSWPLARIALLLSLQRPATTASALNANFSDFWAGKEENVLREPFTM